MTLYEFRWIAIIVGFCYAWWIIHPAYRHYRYPDKPDRRTEC